MWPSDLDYGIFGYEFHGKPLGGVIKRELSDFNVIEVDPHTKNPIQIPPKPIAYNFEEGGLFLVGRIWRKGLDHARMIRLISNTFSVPEDHVSTSGIKDARAEIIQLFSVYNPKKEINDPTLIEPGLEIDSFRYSRKRIYPGYMGGNFFNITIKDTNRLTKVDLDVFGKWASEGLLNYYGYQRFGTFRPITAKFGRYLINKDYKSAINLYLGGKSASKDEEFRQHWRDNHDPDELLILWNDIPYIEREILKHLSRRKHDYSGAISKIPNFLLSLSFSSFISLLTNHYLSRRGIDRTPLHGERSVKNNVEIALPSNKWKRPLNSIWEEVFDLLKINVEKDLRPIRHTTRFLFIKLQKWKAVIMNEDTVRVSFQLKPGEYATTVLRQLMQQPPSHFF